MDSKASTWLGAESKYRDHGLLILRIGIGLMFLIAHGWKKMEGGPELWSQIGGAMGNLGITFAPTFWGFMASFTESFGALFFALGLFFRPVSAALFFTMAIAGLFHLMKGDGLGIASHAIEAAIVFFACIFIGPGRFSLDAKLFPGRKFGFGADKR